MEKKTTHRIIGVLVVIALVVILMPLLFGGNHSEVSQTATAKAPPFQDHDEATTPTRVGQPDNLVNANNAGDTSASSVASPENPVPEGQNLGALNVSQPAEDTLHPQTLAQDAGGSLNPADLGPNPQSTPNQPNDIVATQSSSMPISNGPPISSGQSVSPASAVSPGQPLSTGQPLSSGPSVSSGQPIPSTQPLAGQAGQINQPAAQTQPQPPSTTIQTNQFNQPNQLNQNQPIDSVQQGQSPQPPVQNPGATPAAPSSPSTLSNSNQPMSNPSQSIGTPSLSSSDSSNTASVSQTISLNADGNVIAADGNPVTATTNQTLEKSTKKVALNKSSKKHSGHVRASSNSEPTQVLNQTAWVVQMGSFHNKENAQRLADNLRAKGFKAFTREVKSSTRVYVGPEFKQASAESLINKLQSAVNIQGIVITYHPLEL